MPQRKFRVKRLWIKARLVYHFIRMKQSANEGLNHQNNGKNEEDADVDLENINSQQENVWRWYIIRTENTLPQLWTLLVNSLTVYAMFVTPFVLVFSET